jgi:hypothetical protein
MYGRQHYCQAHVCNYLCNLALRHSLDTGSQRRQQTVTVQDGREPHRHMDGAREKRGDRPA